MEFGAQEAVGLVEWEFHRTALAVGADDCLS